MAAPVQSRPGTVVALDWSGHAEWRPQYNRGWYAARIVAVKQKYGMYVDAAERDALTVMLREDPSRDVTC